MKKIVSVASLIIAIAGSSLAAAADLAELGLEKVNESRNSVAHMNLDKDFSRYDSVVIMDMVIDEVKVKQPRGSAVHRSNWKMDEKRQANAQAMYRKAFEREFARAEGLEVVEEANANSLILVARLKEVAPSVGYDPHSYAGRNRVYSEGSGSASIELFLIDAASGEVVAAAASSRQLGHVWGLSNSVSSRSDAQFALNMWAKQAREAVEKLPEIASDARD